MVKKIYKDKTYNSQCNNLVEKTKKNTQKILGQRNQAQWATRCYVPWLSTTMMPSVTQLNLFALGVGYTDSKSPLGKLLFLLFQEYLFIYCCFQTREVKYSIAIMQLYNRTSPLSQLPSWPQHYALHCSSWCTLGTLLPWLCVSCKTLSNARKCTSWATTMDADDQVSVTLLLQAQSLDLTVIN